MVSNNILAFFCRLTKFYFITVYTKVCVSKATIVAYAFLVQYFENAIIVAYADLGLIEGKIEPTVATQMV